MSSKYGILTPQVNNHEYPFRGEIKTRGFQSKFDMKRIGKNSENAPDFELVDREGFSVGNAWEKEIQRGELCGRKLYSMTFDEPEMDKPLNVTAFPTQQDGGDYDIKWSRPKQSQAEA